MVIKKFKYISLQDATKYCDYSQEYLSLRARQGKLKATKFGRNWVTTKPWLKSYVKQVNNHKKNQKFRVRKIKKPDIYEIKSEPKLISKPKIQFTFLPASLREALQTGTLSNIVKKNLQGAATATAVFVLFFVIGVFALQQIDDNPEFIEQIADSVEDLAFDAAFYVSGVQQGAEIAIDDSRSSISTVIKNANFQKIGVQYFLASTINVLEDTFKDYGKWVKNNYLAINNFALNETRQIKQAWFEAAHFVFEDVKQAVGFIARPWHQANLAAIINENSKVVAEQIELKDKVTGELYCIFIKNGELKMIHGACID